MGPTDDIQKTKLLVGALLRMSPKPHSEMKLGKPKRKSTKSPEKKKPSRGASAKPKTA